MVNCQYLGYRTESRFDSEAHWRPLGTDIWWFHISAKWHDGNTVTEVIALYWGGAYKKLPGPKPSTFKEMRNAMTKI